MLRAIACVTSILSAGSAALADELSETGVFVDGVAAVVNDGVVLKSQLRDQTAVVIERAAKSNPPMQLPPPDMLRDQLLEALIVKEIQLQRAERIGLQVSDAMLNQAIEQLAITQGVRFEDMPAILAEEGISYPEFRREFRDEVTLEQLRQIDVGNRIAISPREIEQCIADLEENVAVDSDYNLSHILVSIPESATAREVEAIEEKAEDIYRQLQEGADFATMALQYSNAQTALEGGALGWMKGSELPTIYTDVVVTLESGGYSEPFRSASSFHIVKVNDMRSSIERSQVDQVLVRHILITPNEIIDDETARQRLEDALERMDEGEEFGEIAKLLSDDPGSANEGGEMPWATPDTFVPEFAEVVNALDKGVISEPFRSRYGWHILEVLDRRVYDNTEDLKELNCQNRLVNGKMGEETQLWVQRLRDQAYVEKRL
ncbi:MAG: peptidylprolyl isomerase [Woeseiaceae bacterium]|nr:peptidylprolyl isomerase [Woeseiaceae bacterium]